MHLPQQKSWFVLAYLALGLLVGYLVWNRLVSVDLGRCHEVIVCQRQYLFIYPFSILAWPLVSTAIVLWEPAGFVALVGTVGLMVTVSRLKRQKSKLK